SSRQHPALDDTAWRLKGELGIVDEVAVPKITRENAQTISTLFRFAAVGIEYTQGKFRPVGGQRPEQNAVRTHAEVSMTNHLDLRLSEQGGRVLGVDHQVIVSQGVVFGKLHGAANLPSRVDFCPRKWGGIRSLQTPERPAN